MILKASQRGGASALALHLLNHENEHIEVHELKGFIAQDVAGAFKEIYAVSRATQCKKFMFSLSLSPPQEATAPIETFEKAIERIEKNLGLTGQSRAIVFHEKQGRRHAHCVWSRIDTQQMKAIKLPYFKERLNAIGKELYLENGWDMPKGFANRALSDHRNFTLSEWQQAKRHGLDPREIKAAISSAWQASDNLSSLSAALEEKGFFLARGDRRGFVVIDWNKEVYALARSANIKTKVVKARLGSPENLPSVDETRARITKYYAHLHDKFRAELSAKHQQERAPLNQARLDMLKQQRVQRHDLKTKQTERNIQETTIRQAKIRTGLAGLWDFITGQSHKQRKQNEHEALRAHERDRKERENIIKAQLHDRQALQQQLTTLRQKQRQDIQQLDASFNNSIANRTHFEP